MPAPTRVTFKVTDEDVGRRLDQVLAARVPGLSRRQARVLLDIGGVFVDKRRIKIAGRAMHAGEEVVAVLGGALARATGRTGTSAREGDERRLPAYAIVFEDEALIVVDKPAGLLTAPTPESDRNNLSDLLARRQEGKGAGQGKPGKQPGKQPGKGPRGARSSSFTASTSIRAASWSSPRPPTRTARSRPGFATTTSSAST